MCRFIIQSGKLFMKRNISDITSYTLPVDLREQPAGIYHVTLKSDKKTMTRV